MKVSQWARLESNGSGDYDGKDMKIKLDSDDTLPSKRNQKCMAQ